MSELTVYRYRLVFIWIPFFWEGSTYSEQYGTQKHPRGSTGRDEWCLPRSPNLSAGLVWPWHLTWRPDLKVDRLMRCSCLMNHLCQSASKWVYLLSKYRVHKFDKTWTRPKMNLTAWRRLIISAYQMFAYSLSLYLVVESDCPKYGFLRYTSDGQ